jgi:hypothetical protein
MKTWKAVRDVPEIQKDLAIVIEELAAIRRRLRDLQKETEQTPDYRFSLGSGDVVPDISQITVGWMLHGSISETIGNLDDVVINLSEARTPKLKAFLKSIKEKV